MRRKKNGFLTFIFSLLPGAAEMYMGFMKQGLSLMGLFSLLIFMAAYLNMGQLFFLMPLLWFYGFFHAHNLRGMRDEEFYTLEDDYLFNLDQILPRGGIRNKTYRYVLAGFLILIGGSMLLNNAEYMVRWCFPQYIVNWYKKLAWVLPQMVIAGCFIAGGIWLIRGKKLQLDDEEQKKIGMKVPEEEGRNDWNAEWKDQRNAGGQEGNFEAGKIEWKGQKDAGGQEENSGDEKTECKNQRNAGGQEGNFEAGNAEWKERRNESGQEGNSGDEKTECKNQRNAGGQEGNFEAGKIEGKDQGNEGPEEKSLGIKQEEGGIL